MGLFRRKRADALLELDEPLQLMSPLEEGVVERLAPPIAAVCRNCPAIARAYAFMTALSTSDDPPCVCIAVALVDGRDAPADCLNEIGSLSSTLVGGDVLLQLLLPESEPDIASVGAQVYDAEA
jgi:hypothetical protein